MAAPPDRRCLARRCGRSYPQFPGPRRRETATGPWQSGPPFRESKAGPVFEPTFAPFRITICGLEELPGHCARGVTHVLSIMDPGLPPPPAFGAFGEHARLDLRFDDVIEDVAGRTPPLPTHVEAVLAFGRGLAEEARMAPICWCTATPGCRAPPPPWR